MKEITTRKVYEEREGVNEKGNWVKGEEREEGNIWKLGRDRNKQEPENMKNICELSKWKWVWKN